MTQKVRHNNLGQSKEYLDNLEILFSDYSRFREKHFSQQCLSLLNPIYPDSQLFLTHSATGALEMVALLLNLQPGDEIILPSFTYVASVTPFVLRGAVPVFVDIDPATLNMDINLVESAVTEKTRAVLCMHYGGEAVDMDTLRAVCDKYRLALVEDAAMGFGRTYKGRPLGSIGDFGVLSFDITKHISAIQGGLLLVNNTQYTQRASVVYHLGTNRTAFMEGEVPYFEWVDVGSKYQMPEMSAAVLEVQLRKYKTLLEKRNRHSMHYRQLLTPLADAGYFRMMSEEQAQSGVHLFYLLLPDRESRDALIAYLKNNGIEALFHYVPLHTSQYGKVHGRFVGAADETGRISNGLLRLPLHAEMEDADVEYVCDAVRAYYSIPG